MRDPYDILGVKRTASDADIKSAYRRLAKQHHPDLHPGDADAESRFKDISAAFAILGDPEKRRRFDAGEIDASGAEHAYNPFHRGQGGGGGGSGFRQGEWQTFHGGDAAFADVFDDLFGRAHGRRRQPAKGADVTYSLTVDFLDAVNGGRQTVTLPDGNSLAIMIPAGTENGDKLRLRGKGHPGPAGAPPGDAIVQIGVRPHPQFRRDGSTITSTLPIGLDEAVLGAKVDVPTITGPVKLTVPPGSSSGKVLRLKGKGVPDKRSDTRGDHLVELQIVLPKEIDPDLEHAIRAWSAKHRDDPRH
ncbi:MAG: J domain-containing protein [Azospirillaceae bacterium]